MRNQKLYHRNRQFMWVNIMLAVFVIGIVVVFLYFCGML